jgi:Ca2+-binding EF-hand superfamily protein
MRIFKIFAKQQGQITYEHLKKIFDLIGFQMNEPEFNLMTRFADETGDGWISAFEFANQIVYAKELAPQFDINKWIVASRFL